MECPRCHTPLASAEVAGATASLCPDCHGVWIGGECILALARAPREVLEASPLAVTLVATHHDVPLGPKLTCPVCAVAMVRHVYCVDSGVTIDRCRQHGVWLDDGELKSVLDYLGEIGPDGLPVIYNPSIEKQSLLDLLFDWGT